MRKIKVEDVFAGVRLIKAAGIKAEVERVALEANKSKSINIEKVGAELILSCIEGLANKGSEEAFYQFISGPFEMTPDEVRDLGILELIEKIKQFKEVEDAEGWKAFFSSLAALMK